MSYYMPTTANKKSEISVQSIITVGCIILIWSILLLRDIFDIGFNRYIILAVAVMGMIASDIKGTNIVLFALLPFMSGIPSTYIFAAYILIRFLKHMPFSAISVILIAFAAVSEMLASAFYQSASIMQLFNHIIGVSVFFILINESEGEDHAQVLKFYFYSTAVVCFIIIANGLLHAPSNWLELFAKGWFRFGATEVENATGMKLTLNANTLGYYSISGMSIGLVLFGRSKGIGKVLQLGCMAICLLAGFLSLSRSWMLIAAVTIILYVSTTVRSPKTAVLTVLALGLASVVVASVLSNNPEIMEGFQTRFSDDTMATGGGRTELLLQYLEKFSESVRVAVFGAGCVEYRTVLDMPTSMHNGTEQMLVCYGFLGMTVFLYGMFRTVVRIRRGVSAIYWLPMIATLLFVQTIQFVFPTYLLMPYIPTVYCVWLGNRK